MEISWGHCGWVECTLTFTTAPAEIHGLYDMHVQGHRLPCCPLLHQLHQGHDFASCPYFKYILIHPLDLSLYWNSSSGRVFCFCRGWCCHMIILGLTVWFEFEGLGWVLLSEHGNSDKLCFALVSLFILLYFSWSHWNQISSNKTLSSSNVYMPKTFQNFSCSHPGMSKRII